MPKKKIKKGRPLLFESEEEMQEAIDRYFDTAKTPTISGLAYELGFVSRQSFYDYEKRDDFSYTIKRARLRIEMMYEEKLVGNNVAGPVFALKNLGWSDKQEISHSGIPEATLPPIIINTKNG